MRLNNIIVFILLGFVIKAQNNLIHNGTFEDVEPGKDWPCKKAMADHLDVWEDDHNFVYLFNTVPCTYLDCNNLGCSPCKLYHTPDWYINDISKYRYLEKVGVATNNTNIMNPINGHSGIGFIGMRPAELIEQKFFNSNPIKGGTKYTFSMYVRIPNELTNGVSSAVQEQIYGPNNNAFIYNIMSQFPLSVYLSTSKMKYNDGVLTCNKGDEGDDVKDLVNNIVKLKEFTISPLNYPYGQWHRVTFDFVCPTAHNYDWIAIEQGKDLNDAANQGYILIDEVTLVESCELSCYATSGIPYPVMSTPSSGYNVPLKISNLSNIRKIHAEIFPLTGQNAIFDFTYEYTNGIPFDVYYNGDTYSAPAASGVYICKLTCENECGSFTFTQQFANLGTAPPYWSSPPHSLIEERNFNSCCILDFYLSNRDMNNSHYYKPRNNIYVSSNVNFKNGSNTSLVAGQQIEFLSEVGTDPTAELAAYIEDCADSHRLIDNVLTDKDFIFYQNSEAYTQLGNLNTTPQDFVRIYPNPSKEKVSLELKNKRDGLDYFYEVFDVNGKTLVYSQIFKAAVEELDLTSFKEGVYFLRITNPLSEPFIKKIVKLSN